MLYKLLLTRIKHFLKAHDILKSELENNWTKRGFFKRITENKSFCVS